MPRARAGRPLRWLDSLGLGWPPVDELALEVAEGLGNISHFIEQGWLSGQVSKPLLALDAHLGKMSGQDHARLCTVDALRDAPEWAQSRELALEVLLQV